jgi:vitamin B12 transporter
MKKMVFIVCLLPNLVIAAPPVALDAMVVTATRTPQSKADSLASVEIITKADIEKRQSRSLTQLLNSQMSLDVTNNGGFGSAANVFIRGTNNDHVLVMVDGVKMGSASLGTFAFESIQPEMIERIEIIRGSRSSLYGSEAIGGVIHIFTKKGSSKSQSFFKASYGTHETTDISVGASGASGQTKYALSLNHFETEGIDIGSGNNADKDGYYADSVVLNLSHQWSDNISFGTSFLQNDGETEFDNFFGVARDFIDVLQQSAHVYLNYSPTDYWDMKWSIGESRDEATTFNGKVESDTFNTKRQQADWQNNFYIGDADIITAGVDFIDDQLKSTQVFSETSRDNWGAYAQWQSSFDIVDWVLAYRVDENEAFGRKKTGSLGMGLTLPHDIKLTASYSTAFKSPTFNDLFFPDLGFFKGNPNLTPESSKTKELGIRQTTDWGNWELNIFQTEVDDLIQFQGNQNVNIPSATIKGIEFQLSTELWEWQTNLQMSYIDPKDDANDNVLNDRARRTFALTMDREFNQWTVGGEFIAKGHRFGGFTNERLSGYHVTNLNVSYAVDKHWQIFSKVDNAFNKTYQTKSGFNTLKRTVYMGFQYR